MSEEGYNGYKNYETWVTALWMSNDANAYFYWREVTKELMRENDDKDSMVAELADRIHVDIEGGICLDAGLYSDLMQSAIDNIDFYELAEGLLGERDERED